MRNACFALSMILALTACKMSAFEDLPTDCLGLTLQHNLNMLRDREKWMAGKDAFKVALVSDSHNGYENLTQILKKINARSDIDFVLALGDLTDNGYAIELQDTCLALKTLRIPFLPVIGNHDSLSTGKQLWQEYFGPFNYSFTFLGTKFIAYNDNSFEFENVPDMDFIAEESKVEPGEIRHHTIAAAHVPPGTEMHTPEHWEKFLKTLDTLGIHFTVHGHLHTNEYWKDAHGNPHFITNATRNNGWAIMTVTSQKVQMENCDPDCVPVEPK